MPNYILSTDSLKVGPVFADGIAEAQAIAALLGANVTIEEVAVEAPAQLSSAQKLAEDRAFGAGLVQEFLTDAKNANLPLSLAESVRAKLATTEYWLLAGSIGVARDALQAVEANILFPQTAKDYYLSRINEYLKV